MVYQILKRLIKYEKLVFMMDEDIFNKKLFENKIAIVTGASSGIGEATAIELAKSGCTVAICARRENELKRVLKEVKKYASESMYKTCDVSKTEQIKDLVDAVYKKYGRIDILINNAAMVLVKPLDETSEDDFRTVVDTNYKNVVSFVKYTVPYMKKGSSIVNVASISGHVGEVNHAVYGGTKGAVISLTRALAWELAPKGIRINSISPGSIDTPMLRNDVAGEAKRRGVSPDVIRKETENKIAIKRWADPKEIAYGIVFFASKAASYVNGTDLLMDGGEAAG